EKRASSKHVPKGHASPRDPAASESGDELTIAVERVSDIELDGEHDAFCWQREIHAESWSHQRQGLALTRARIKNVDDGRESSHERPDKRPTGAADAHAGESR